MTNDEKRSADPEAPPSPVDSPRLPSDTEHPEEHPEEHPSLADSWAALSNPAEPEEIRDAVRDALAIPEGQAADPGSTPGEDADAPLEIELSASDSALPPPPDLSGSSFEAWDEDTDEGPEFFHETVNEPSLALADDDDHTPEHAFPAAIIAGTSEPQPDFPNDNDNDDNDNDDNDNDNNDENLAAPLPPLEPGIPTDDDDDGTLAVPPPPPDPGIPADDDDDDDDLTVPAAASAPGIEDAGEDDENLTSKTEDAGAEDSHLSLMIRLGTAISVDVTDDDDDDDLGELVEAARSSVGLPVIDEGEGQSQGEHLGRTASDEDTAPALDLGPPEEDDAALIEVAPPTPRPPQGPADPQAARSDTWLKHWTSEMVALPEDEDELRALAAMADPILAAQAAPAAESRPAAEIVEIVIDDPEAADAVSTSEFTEASLSFGQAASAGDEADAAGSGSDPRGPRPRPLWIADDADPPTSFYGDPFPLDRWQDPECLVERVIDGRYRLRRALGRGDAFRVYLAERLDTRGPIVLKLLGPEYPPTEDRAQLFRREARAMARLRNPRVVEVLDVGTTTDGLSYMALEFLRGPTLSALLAAEGPLPWARAAALVRQVLEVTAYLHARGQVHRTLHPANIYFVGEENGEPRIKLTNVSLTPLATHYRRSDGKLAITPEGLLGSAEYMAPEVVSGNLPDAQSDVYAAGILLYELLAGRPPFLADSLMGLLKKHLYEAPVTLRATVHAAEIPDGIEGVLLKALEKDPEARHRGIGELAEALEAAEVRQRELSRTKSLLAAVDAALWDDHEAMEVLATQAPQPERWTLHDVPIAPLTDEDLSMEERATRNAQTAQAAQIAQAAQAAQAAQIAQGTPAAPQTPPLAGPKAEGDGRRYLPVLAIIALAAIFVPLLIHFGQPAETPTSSPAALPPPAVPASPPPLPPPVLDPSEGPPDPSEGPLPDPSEGAVLDPSEGLPEPEEKLEPEEKPEPEEKLEPEEKKPEEKKPEEKKPEEKKPKAETKPARALSEAAIRSKLSTVRSKVSKQCGQATGLFAPVGLTVKVRVDVNPSGQAKATPSKSGTAIGRCVVEIVEGLRFPKTAEGGSTTHTFKL